MVFTDKFFSHTYTERAYTQLTVAVTSALAPHIERFRSAGWQQALATSGTARHAYKVSKANGWLKAANKIDIEALYHCRAAVLQAGNADKLDLEGLKPSRRPVFAAGTGILIALMEALQLEQLQLSDNALREGLLVELMKKR